ncbi:MAG TPA: YdeI/OmpD-associated family protein [Candidatus Acidoferrales bacterium]|nr:YdeI/OmpD-associated family protein [Candidatus Acidoferrales bacterium]
MNRIYARDGAAWRAWLQLHGASKPEVWLIYYKKGSGKPTVSFDEALDEALCFGWVDTKVKGLDDRRYMMRFTPRKPSSSWSPSNIERVKRLLKQQRVTAAGRAAFAGHDRRKTAPPPTKLAPALQRHFESRRAAWKNFSGFPPGYRRLSIGWVASAKQEQTRLRRLERLIEHSARGERLAFI